MEPLKLVHHAGFGVARTVIGRVLRTPDGAVGAARHLVWYVSYQVHGRGGGPRPPRGDR